MDRDCPEPTGTQRNLDLLGFTKALTLKSQILCVQTFLAGGEGVTTSGAHINGLCNRSNIMTTFKGLFLLYCIHIKTAFSGIQDYPKSYGNDEILKGTKVSTLPNNLKCQA